MAGLCEQFLGGNRSPSSSGVKFPVRERLAIPTSANGVYDLPCGFDFVAADEKGGIASDRFKQETFVGLGRIGAEFRVVTEVHSHGTNADLRAGHFAVEAHVNALDRCANKTARRSSASCR